MTTYNRLHTSLRVKSFPTVSRNMLKKHSTSSVELARGCSTGILFIALYFLLHSLDSMLAASATNTSLVKPLILFMFLSTIEET